MFAAAVVLCPEKAIRGLKDSKVLEAARREVLAERIRERAICWAVGACDAYEIDRINIYQARRLAMRRAIEKLSPPCDYLLVDALHIDLPLSQEAVIHGDAQCQCIAAASILAKTERDHCMRKWHQVFPQYGLDRHKGYGTEEHVAALKMHGPTNLHRFSFEPVRLACQYELWSGYEQTEPQADRTLTVGA